MGFDVFDFEACFMAVSNNGIVFELVGSFVRVVAFCFFYGVCVSAFFQDCIGCGLCMFERVASHL